MAAANSESHAGTCSSAKCLASPGAESGFSYKDNEVASLCGSLSDADLADDFLGGFIEEQFLTACMRRSPYKWQRQIPEVPPPPSKGPGRLHAAVGGCSDPFHRAADGLGAKPMNFEDMPAFRHLAALEEAVTNGSLFDKKSQGGGIPQLHSTTGSALPALSIGSPRSPPRSARDVFSETKRWGPAITGGKALVASGRLASGIASGAEVVAADSSSNYARGNHPMSFTHSALRGVPLPKGRRGPHSTNAWLSTETARLRAEVAKTSGSSAAYAFFQNGGPQRMENLSAPLIAPEILRKHIA